MSVKSSSSYKSAAGVLAVNRFDGMTSKPARISATSVGNNFIKKGSLNVISLKDGNSDLPEGIEEITMDFANIHKGLVETAVVPLTLKLKEAEHNKKLKMATMDKIVMAMKKLGGKEGKPFIKFEKIQFMYIPLFSQEEGENGEISISLQDSGKEDAGKDPIIKRLIFDASEMAIVELSRDFFVRKEEMDKISINITAKGVPIEGRSYGALNVAFFTFEESIPIKSKTRPSTVLYIDSVNRPKDITRSSVFKKIGDNVTKNIDEKRLEFKRRELERSKEMRKSKRNFKMERSSTSSGSSVDPSDLIEEGRKSVSVLSKYLEDQRSAPNPLKQPRRTVRIEGGNGLLTMLDTGSADHYLYVPTLRPNTTVDHFGGVDKASVEEMSVELKAFGNWFNISFAYGFNDLRMGSNLLSYSKLVEDKLVDAMETAGDSLFLKKDDEIVMIFDTCDPGRMWLKDDKWNEVTNGGQESANVYLMEVIASAK
nr:TPA_asm: movement protein [Osteospermum ophiovirus]